jgi:excisionase family DNA binding protein
MPTSQEVNDLLQRKVLTVPQAGKVLGIGRDSAYRAANAGELPVLKLGRRLVVPVPRLLEMLGYAVPTSPENSEGEPSDSSPIASIPIGTTQIGRDQHDAGDG